MNRREFIATLAIGSLIVALPAQAKEKELLWHLHFDLLKDGFVCMLHTNENTQQQLYCAFIIRNSDRYYTLDEMWNMYGRPATMAIYRGLKYSDERVEEQRKPFEECLGKIRIWNSRK